MTLSCDDYITLTQRFFPLLKFSRFGEGSQVEHEPFFPVDPDGWITHRALDPSETNVNKRGTSLHKWDVDSDWIDAPAVAGAGTLELHNGNNGIGHDDLAGQPTNNGRQWFLNFGGWQEPATKGQGLLDYTWERYDETVNTPQGLSSNQPRDFAPGGGPDHADRFNPQVGLHAYAEFRPLEGVIEELLSVDLPPELDFLEPGARTVPDDIGDLKQTLDSMIAINYYLFYPAAITLFPGGIQKHREGDWEIVSVYLVDKEGRGDLDDFDLAYASYSRGWEGKLFSLPSFPESRSRQDMEFVGQRPVVYVAYGSHANFFRSLNEPFSTPQTDTAEGADWGMFGWRMGAAGIGIVAGVLLIVIGILLIETGTGIALIVIGAALIALALAIAAIAAVQLVSELTEGGPEPEPQPFDANDSESEEFHDGTGPALGGNGAVIAEDASPTPSGEVIFYNHPIAGDPGIDDPAAKCQPPAWWSYSGRWGTSVALDTAMQDNSLSGWKNGTWRKVADQAYSLTHRNAEALLDFLTATA